MPRFFCEYVRGDTQVITGADADHITKSLRMKPGDDLIICDTYGYEYDCKIASISKSQVKLKILNRQKTCVEPDVRVTLFQGIPKGNKFDLICQKTVEMGVDKIVPVLMERSIAKMDNGKRIMRLQRISDEAAKQSGRGIKPKVCEVIRFSEAVAHSSSCDISLFFYENGGQKVGNLLKDSHKDISIFIGPEGGFSLGEVEMLQNSGALAASLGPRILRTETAPIAALSLVMYLTGNL